MTLFNVCDSNNQIDRIVYSNAALVIYMVRNVLSEVSCTYKLLDLLGYILAFNREVMRMSWDFN